MSSPIYTVSNQMLPAISITIKGNKCVPVIKAKDEKRVLVEMNKHRLKY